MSSIVKMTVLATVFKAAHAFDDKINYQGLELTTIGVDADPTTALLSSVCVPVVMTTTSCETITIPATTTEEVVVDTPTIEVPSSPEVTSSPEVSSSTEIVTSTEPVHSTIVSETSSVPTEDITESGAGPSRTTLGGLFIAGLVFSALF